jgi:ribonuclease HI
MFFDGALNLEGAGAGVLLIFPQGEQLKYILQIHYKASNNGPEYKALTHGLRIAVSLGIKRLLAFGDSKVVIEQDNKEWDCVKDTMDAYCAEIRKLEDHFEGDRIPARPTQEQHRRRRTLQTRLSSSSSPSRPTRPRFTQAFNQAPVS